MYKLGKSLRLHSGHRSEVEVLNQVSRQVLPKMCEHGCIRAARSRARLVSCCVTEEVFLSIAVSWEVILLVGEATRAAVRCTVDDEGEVR